tara:strand:+ start:5790 stop:7361 length:1572 start_codon:yes stop_codon:yes gene_type:complete
MPKQYESKLTLQNKILNGANILADNVASTLGPRGRNVIIQRKDARPIITKDGVTVAKFIDLEDPFENLGAQAIKQAAAKTNSDAGDGTTTATVLARALLRRSQKYLISGASPIELKRGMDKTIERIVSGLREISKPIKKKEDVEHIATISANGDETIGKLIATAVDLVGNDGSITIEDARSYETSLDIVEGFRIDSGYSSPQFITDESRGVTKYDNPFVLVTDFKIELVEDMLPVLEVVAREGRPLVIVAEEVSGQALAALIMNSIRGTMKVAAVKAPCYGQERRDILKDLAISIGAEFITRETGHKLKETKLEHLGVAKSIEITKNMTTIMDGNGDEDEIEKRIEALKAELNQTDNIHECERIQGRITRLASGIAVIRVGAATELEMVEKKHRIIDALEAVKAAQQEGVVPGGGTALIRASEGLEVETDNEEQELGKKIVLLALSEPVRQMAQNAGESPDIIIQRIKYECEGNNGYDFANRRIVDLVDAGIIDPTKVTRCALQNAVSVTSTLITTNHAIVEA